MLTQPEPKFDSPKSEGVMLNDAVNSKEETVLLPFIAPATVCISGGTGCGKTTFCYQLMRESTQMFTQPVHKILYCYGVYQNLYEEMEQIIPNLEFHEGLPSQSKINELTQDMNHNLVILDDLALSVTKSSDMEQLFCQTSHHRNLSVIFLTQNLFHSCKSNITISLNVHYLVLFRNFRDGLQIKYIARQLYPSKPHFLVEAYEQATRTTPHGYLLVDMSPHAIDTYRLRTHIFQGEDPFIFTPV